MSISAQPTNTNLAQASKYLLSFSRLPYVTYFCTRCNLPGISSTNAIQATPFIDRPVPPDKMVYDHLEIEFLIDEPLWSWITIQDWIMGLTFPKSFNEYKNLRLQQALQLGVNAPQSLTPQYSDATLTILSNKNNPIVTVTFQEVFPIILSGIEFNTAQPATQVLSSKATFAFTNYKISHVPAISP